MSKISEIREQGWTDALFIMPERDRAEYARLANAVIGIALEDEAVRDSLAIELNPELEQGNVRTGLFGIGFARNSADQKVYLHTGFQSRARADAAIPLWTQPAVMQEFWRANTAMLNQIERSTLNMLKILGATPLGAVVFTPDQDRRNVHLRTVRYPHANAQTPGTEVVSGHADLGLMTLHLYETHAGWFYGAPYPGSLITAEDSPERRAAVRALRASMRPIEQKDDYAPFFLGANWQTFPNVPMELRDLPACYHAGFRPTESDEAVSPYAAAVTGDTDDRVSVVSFMHPNGDVLKQGTYLPATFENCRPEHEE